MLQLKNITKDYIMSKDLSVHALKNVSINFRKNEFVSILGPSGCGKTTLLNIIGGLDHYTFGDLIINGKSTKDFKDRDWDDYRNKSVGFVFQSYNLIPHINILSNVAMGLTLSGIKNKERVRMAKEALVKVGLGSEIKKKPNQLSGGQMQRVAIARAIVGNPDIILADEPTGALDTETGVQVMEILKEISKEKLVIMVTHNGELANRFSDRIIKITDGVVTDDSNAYSDSDIECDQKAEEKNLEESTNNESQEDLPKIKKKKSKMNLLTAFNLSGRTLLSKKGRTIITSIAGSIGIFAISLIIAISTGMTAYVNRTQDEAVGKSAIYVLESAPKLDPTEIAKSYNAETDMQAYPTDVNVVYPYTDQGYVPMVKNNITNEYVDYLKAMDKSLTKTIDFEYSVRMNVIRENGGKYTPIYGESYDFSDFSSQIISNSALVGETYDVLYKAEESATGIPQNKNELALVVDKYNRVSAISLAFLGFDMTDETINYANIVGKAYKYIPNNLLYTYNSETDIYSARTDYENLYNDASAVTLKIVSILRIKNDDVTAWLQTGLVYAPALTDYIIEDAKASTIGQAQLNSPDQYVLNGGSIVDTQYATAEETLKVVLQNLSVYDRPTTIRIYPADIDSEIEITKYLNAWNENHPENKIEYTNFVEFAFDMLAQLIDVISYVLIAFCAISLIVSTVMISVTTYTSVIERTKEIGVLRALGARKRDIASIFNAETVMIGFFAGLIGVAISGLFAGIINIIISHLAGISGLVHLSFLNVLIMVSLSIVLTLLAGLIPSSIAAKKDPVECLRTE
ncbi:MAG: ATP-binding cassette domain-containing protein [Clostridia bacterium]|nr:ATP-binding cassette domain-containing protein [Clostridia bacterium]